MSLTCISYKSPDVISIAKSLGLPAQVIAAEISVMMGKQESKNVPNIVSSPIMFNRQVVEKDNKTLYIFTDNTNRTSGSKQVDKNSWYAKKYGEHAKYPTQTTAVLRGLENAFPVSTQRWYDLANKRTKEAGRWQDDDIDEFKKVIDDEFNTIIQAWNSGQYNRIVIPSGDGFFNSKIANISEERTPKLYKHLQNKLQELQNLNVNNVEVSNFPSKEQVFQYLTESGFYDRPQIELPEYTQTIDEVDTVFDATTKSDRANLIAWQFSNRVDKFMEQNPTLSRKKAIDMLRPAEIFNGIKQSFEKALQSNKISEYQKGEFQKIIDNFDALAKLSAQRLSFREDLAFDLNSQETTAIDDTADTPDGDTGGQEDNHTTQEQQVKDGWMTKAKHQSSMHSASQQIKRMLATLQRVGYDNEVETDDLGYPRYVDYGYAAGALMGNLRFMTKSEDLMVDLYKMAENKPWVYEVIDKLEQDPVLTSQFYKVMRKDFVPMTVISAQLIKGKYLYKTVRANQLQGITPLIEEWKDILNSATLISDKSVYNVNGRLNKENIATNNAKFTELVDKYKKGLPTSTSEKRNAYIEQFVTDHALDLLSLTQALGIDIDSTTLQMALVARMYNDGQIQLTPSIERYMDEMSTIYHILNTKEFEKDDKGNEKRLNIYQEFSGHYNNLAGIIAAVTEAAIESSTFENGKMHYSHQVPSYIGKLMKNLKNVRDNDKAFQEFINKEFKRYPFFYRNGEWQSDWIAKLASSGPEGVKARELFDYETLLSFGKVDYSNLNELDYTVALIQNFFIDDEKGNYAKYHVPILSDSPTGAFITFDRVTDVNAPKDFNNKKMTYKEVLLEKFVQVATQELWRMQIVERRKQGIINGNIEEITNWDKNGDKFWFLPGLNEHLDTIKALMNDTDDKLSGVKLKQFLKEKIEESINKDFTSTIEQWKKIGLFEKVSKTDKALKFLNIPNGTNEETAIKQLENYFWNSKFATTQIIQLTNTDLSFFKNIEDFQKRNKQIYAPAERLNTESEHGREFEKTMTIKDNEIASKKVVRDGMKTLFNNKVATGQLSKVDAVRILANYGAYNYKQFTYQGVTYRDHTDNDGNNAGYFAIEKGKHTKIDKETYKQTLQIANEEAKASGKKVKEDEFYTVTDKDKKVYTFKTKSINETDAQAYRSLSSYRAVLDMAGKWTPAMEESYTRLKDGTWTAQDYDMVFQPFKPFMYTQVAREVGVDENGEKIYMKVPVQNKNSELLLLPMLGVEKESSTLKALNDFMETNGVDVIQFESTVKAGLQGAVRINPSNSPKAITKILNEALTNPQKFYVVPYEDYGLQQEVPEHYMDSTQLFGTQLRKLITADMDDNMIITMNIGGTNFSLSKKQWIDLYNGAITANIMDSFRKINDKFSSPKAVEEILQQELYGNLRYGPEIAKACTLDENGKFNMPLFEPSQSMRIQTLVNSIIRSQITKQKIKGGSLVQATNFGLSDDLNIVFSEDGKSIKYFECYMPWYSKEYLSELLDENNELDIEKLEREAPELLDLIGYRIPTEDKYSMVPLKIKGFLPQQSGGVIMLPSEITTISGSDFDIDKLYIMLPEFKIDYNYDIESAWKDFYSANPEIYNHLLDLREADKGNDKLIHDLLVANGVSDESIEGLGKLKLYEYDENVQKQFSEWFKENKDTYKGKANISKLNVSIPQELKKGGQLNDKQFNVLLESLLDNKTAERNNLIIDMIRSILTHENTGDKILNPGGFDIQKKSARIISLLQLAGDRVVKAAKKENKNVYEYLNAFSLEELDSYVNSFKENLDITNPTTQVKLHQQNMTAAKLIGIAANHNAHHALMQHTQISINPAEAFTLNGEVLTSLHDIKSKDGQYISRTNSGFLAASVDAVKDPVLNYMNLNTFTMDSAMLLSRLGHSSDTIGLLLSQPIIIEIVQEFNNGVKSGVSKISAIDNVIKRYTDDVNTAVKDTKSKFMNADLAENIAIAEIAKSMDAKERNNHSNASIREYYNGQVQVAQLFKQINKVATGLADLVAATRADTSNGGAGPTIADSVNKMNRVQDFIEATQSEKPIFHNATVINHEFDYTLEKEELFKQLMQSDLPYIQAFYSLGVKSTEGLLKDYFPHFKSEFMQVIDDLRRFTKYNRLDIKTMNSVYNDLFTYILSGEKIFGGTSTEIYKSANYYINNFVSDYAAVLEANPDLKKFDIINSLHIKNSQDGYPSSIVFREVGGLSPQQREDMMNSWTNLLNSGETGRLLAIHLFKYSYYRNGFAFGPSSFMHLAPIAVKQSIPGYREALDRILERDYDKNIYSNFWMQYLLNHTNNRQLVPLIDDKATTVEIFDDDTPKDSFDITLTDKSSTEDKKFATSIKKEKEKSTNEEGKIETIEIYTVNWKPVITVEHKGDTLVYINTLAKDGILESTNNARYELASKLGKINQFLFYSYGDDYQGMHNPVKFVATEATNLDKKQEANVYSESNIDELDNMPDYDYLPDYSIEDAYSSSKLYSIAHKVAENFVGFADNNTPTNVDFLSDEDFNKPAKPLYNNDGSEVC